MFAIGLNFFSYLDSFCPIHLLPKYSTRRYDTSSHLIMIYSVRTWMLYSFYYQLSSLVDDKALSDFVSAKLLIAGPCPLISSLTPLI